MRQKILVPKYVQFIVLPLALLAAVWFINTVLHIIIMFLLAAIIALVLDQPVSFLQERLKFPRVMAVLLVWLVIIGVVAGVLALLVPNIISELYYLIEQLPEYSLKLQTMVDDLRRWFHELDVPYKPDITPEDVSGKLQTAGTDIAMRGLDFATSMFNLGLNIALIFIISIYMLLDTRRLKDAVKNLFPESFRDDALRLFGHMQKALGSYLRGQLLVSTVMGILGGFIAWYGGAGAYVALIAVWVAVTEVIPLIGPFLGAAPAVALAYFAVSPGRALIVMILFLIAQQLEGHLLVPRIMGRSVGVHPLWVMFAVLSGAALGGILGGLLAVPSVAIIKVLVDFYRDELVMEKWDRPLLEKTAAGEGESAS